MFNGWIALWHATWFDSICVHCMHKITQVYGWMECTDLPNSRISFVCIRNSHEHRYIFKYIYICYDSGYLSHEYIFQENDSILKRNATIHCVVNEKETEIET